MTQVLRLVIAPLEPGENTEDLGSALCGKRGISTHKSSGIEGGIGGPASARVPRQKSDLHYFRYVHACILQQRRNVIGSRSHHRILEIEQPDAGCALTLGQPQKIGRMEIA